MLKKITLTIKCANLTKVRMSNTLNKNYFEKVVIKPA